jgi:ribosomal protein L11 methyltransferase
VAAADYEPAALEATRANAAANGVRLDRVERIDVRTEASPFAYVVASNLVRPLLMRVASLIDARPGALIASGLLDEEADEVAAAFAPLRERRRLSDRGWTALLLAP